MTNSIYLKTAFLLAVLLCAVHAVPPASAAQVTYTITDLGVIGTLTPGESFSEAYAINNHGQIAGASTRSDGEVEMFFYNGTMHDLGSGYAHGINNNGIVVGQQDGTEVPCYNANHTTNGQVAIPQLIGNGGIGGDAFAINDENAIVGESDGGDEIVNAYVYQYPSGPLTGLGYYETPAVPNERDYSVATAINDSGLIVGYGQVLVYDPETGFYNPYYSAAVFGSNPVTLLPALAANEPSTASAVNNAGVAVGSASDSSGVSYAVSWNEGGIAVIGPTNSEALGINNAGQIVGDISIPVPFGTRHAFVYTDGKLTDLNSIVTPGKMAGFQYLSEAFAINDSGTIVGRGYFTGPNGGVRGPYAFMAVPSVATVVPPPAAMGALTVSSTDVVPGVSAGASGATFSSFGSPAIDAAGDVAFEATIKGSHLNTTNDTGIWFYQGTNGTLVAITGSEAPDTDGAYFTGLKNPALCGAGQLAFVGTFAGGPGKVHSTNGVFVTKSGTTSLVVQAGDIAPGFSINDTVKFTGFPELMVANGGGVAFKANIAGKINGKTVASTNNTGIWATDTSGGLDLVEILGEDLPDVALPVKGLTDFTNLAEVGGQSRSLDTIGGNLGFLAEAKSPTTNLLLAKVTSSGFAVSTVVSISNAVPALPEAVFTGIGEPVVNSSGTVAFKGKLGGNIDGKKTTSTNNSVISIVPAGVGSDLALAVQTAVTFAPDTSGDTNAGDLFSVLSDPVLDDNGNLAFMGTLEARGDTDKTNNLGIWEDSNGTLERVVRSGDNAPGSKGTFAKFQQLVLPDVGGPIFTATLNGVSSDTNGLWAVWSGGTPTLIVQDGNTLDFNGTTKTVSSFSIFSQPAVVNGQSRSFDASTANIVYVATFPDGTSGIFTVLP